MLEMILLLTVLHILSQITVGEVTDAPKQKGKR